MNNHGFESGDGVRDDLGGRVVGVRTLAPLQPRVDGRGF